MFLSFQARNDLVKMKKLGKKKALTGSWEGPYLFVGYVDEQGGLEQDDGRRKCIIKGKMNNNGSVLKEICNCITWKHH